MRLKKYCIGEILNIDHYGGTIHEQGQVILSNDVKRLMDIVMGGVGQWGKIVNVFKQTNQKRLTVLLEGA